MGRGSPAAAENASSERGRRGREWEPLRWYGGGAKGEWGPPEAVWGGSDGVRLPLPSREEFDDEKVAAG